MLDNIIEKYGLDAVSKKTRISKKNLEKLLKKEFSSFSKPMALGFVSILEREYKYDFSGMKEDIVKWFEDNSESYKNNVVFPPPEDERNRHWIAIIPLIVVIIFGFYLYQNEFSTAELDTKKNIAMKSVKENLDKKVYKEQDNQKQKSLQSNQKIELEISEENSFTKRSDEQKKDRLKNVPVDKNISKSKDIKPKKVNSIKGLDVNRSINSYTPVENIFIYPSKKIWIGVVNLKNWKRTTITTPNTYTIEADSDKLIITGHGFFSLDDLSGNNIKYNDRKKHFFMLKDEELIEVNESKFKKLNGGKIW